MTFRRGASLTTAATFGYADTADLGPSVGNGFENEWPEDLALLAQLGVTDVRITLDWARLQPTPGALDADWSERFEHILVTADAVGLRSWATLHDESVPRWFDDEGGIGDAEAFVRWWPRWVERVADRFGDLVDGWIPFDVVPPDAVRPWRDTWGILGGQQPVVASFEDIDDLDRLGADGRIDRLGVTLAPEWEPAADVPDALLEQAADRWGTLVRSAAGQLDRRPIVVTGFRPGHTDLDMCVRIVETLVSALDLAIDDGIDVEVGFVEPAIAGPTSGHGLLDRDRNPTAITPAYLA